MSQRQGTSLPSEILCTIFEQLDGKDLRPCSVVSQQWTGPASHTLWNRRIVPLPALIGVLAPPTSQFVPYATAIQNLDQIDQKRVARFLDDAFSVSQLLVAQPIPDCIKLVLDMLVQRRGPLCPNLKYMDIHCQLDITDTATMFSTPSLQSIKIRQVYPWSTGAPFDAESTPGNPSMLMQALSFRAPSIQTLDANFTSPALYPVHSMINLRHISHSGPFSFSVWHTIAEHCSLLESFRLGHGCWSNGVQDNDIERCTLPTLRKLDLQGMCDLRLTEHILQVSQMPALLKLAVSLPHQNQNRASTILGPLESGSPLLEDLTIFLSARLSNCVNESLFNSTSFPNLNSLTLQAQLSTQADTRRVVDLLPHDMPYLQSLTLTLGSTGDLYDWPIGMEIQDLAALSQKVQDLKKLQVALDGGSITMPTSAEQVLFPRLKSLVLDPLLVWEKDLNNLSEALAGHFREIESFVATLAFRCFVDEGGAFTIKVGEGCNQGTSDFREAKQRFEAHFWEYKKTSSATSHA